MKTLFVISSLIFSFTAHASFEFADKTYPLYPAASDVRVSTLCPPGVMCITNGTVIDINFKLRGCLDRLGEVKYNTIATTGNLQVMIYAVGIENPKSKTVKCAKQASKQYRITLGEMGNTTVTFLKKKLEI